MIDDSTHTFLSVLAFEESLLWGKLPIQENVFQGLWRRTDDGYWHLHFFFSKHSTLPGVNKIWVKTAPSQSPISLILSKASTLKRSLKLLRTLRERVGGWTIKPEKVCVYKQQQQQQQQNKQMSKQTKKYWTKYRNTETFFFSFSIPSFSISLRFLLVHEQK